MIEIIFITLSNLLFLLVGFFIGWGIKNPKKAKKMIDKGKKIKWGITGMAGRTRVINSQTINGRPKQY